MSNVSGPIPDSGFLPPMIDGPNSIAIIPPLVLVETRDNKTATSNSNETSYQLSLNGLPAFCKANAVEQCAGKPVAGCESCSEPLAILFGVLVAIVGLLIVVGNLLIAWSVFRKKKISKFDVIKASLSFADLLLGILVFAITLPNLAWTMRASTDDMLLKVSASLDTVESESAGIFFVLGFTSSLFHLVLLSAQRLYAVRFPMRYKLQSKFTAVVGIVLAWMLGVITATIPAMFPDVFVYTYNHILFLYYPTLTISDTLFQTGESVSTTPAVIMMVVFYMIPYAFMMLTIIGTLVYIRVSMGRSREMMSLDSHRKSRMQARKKEATVFATVATMIVGFTITLFPLVLVVPLYYAGVVDKSNYPTAYLVAFYLSMSSSLVNVVIYSVRDESFRDTVKSILLRFRPKDISIETGTKRNTRATNLSSGNSPQTRVANEKNISSHT